MAWLCRGNPMPIDAVDLDRLNNLAIETAAAEIMPRFRNLGDDEVDAKESATDLVTVADVSAERKIAAELNRRYPEALVIGEESCDAEPTLLDGLPEASLAFVIDPVDGTFNFAHGVPLFGTMLSVVRNGETIAGLNS